MTFKKIGFVTDSTCDIPGDLIRKWKIGVVPAYVNYGGRSYADDGKELDRASYYEDLATMSEIPTTAAASSGMAQEIIESAFAEVDHLFILTAPAALSGLHNSMRLGAANLPKDRYTLIDSGTLSVGLGWQVMIGAEVAAETGDVGEVQHAISRVRTNQAVYAGLPSLDYLRRSGRVGWARAGIGTLLNIRPLIQVVEGEVLSVAYIRTFGRVLQKLDELTRKMAPLDRLAILHSNNPEGVETLHRYLADIAPEQTFTIVVNPAVGTHIGPGAVGLIPLSRKWRDQ